MKYTKKPVTIEAMEWDGTNTRLVRHWMGEEGACVREVEDHRERKRFLIIPTLEGNHEASPGDMIIRGVEGEYYPCKPDIFEKTYDIAKERGMTFGEALEATKLGKKIARKGWNGKGMWLVLANGTKKARVTMNEGSDYAEAGLTSAVIDPHIDMYTAQGTMQPGWLASQADMLADDWCIV